VASLPPPEFPTRAEYERLFCDAAYWRPYVEEVWRRHDLGPCGEVRSPLPGTYPTFVVDDRRVVKFFGRAFEGARTFAVERELCRQIRDVPDIPAPRLLAEGRLYPRGDAWPWPYLVTEALRGRSFGEVWREVSPGDRLGVARWLADVARRLHELAPGEARPCLRPTWDEFAALLERRRREVPAEFAARGDLPDWLVGQVGGFVGAIDDLIDRRARPRLLHADLTEDHVLGQFRGARWAATGIIDFGDARMGDRLYELVALHLGCFRCDKGLLAAFLDRYGFEGDLRRDFARRATCLTILHEFPVLADLFRRHPALADAGDLRELARRLWDLDAPGLAAE
jgi:hygromycin-B 7''-O-kinase